MSRQSVATASGRSIRARSTPDVTVTYLPSVMRADPVGSAEVNDDKISEALGEDPASQLRRARRRSCRTWTISTFCPRHVAALSWL